jgi:hypothetical protein
MPGRETGGLGMQADSRCRRSMQRPGEFGCAMVRCIVIGGFWGFLHSGVDITRGTDGYLRRIGLQKAQVQVEKIGDYVRDVVTMGGSEGESAKGVQLSRTGCVQDASYS